MTFEFLRKPKPRCDSRVTESQSAPTHTSLEHKAAVPSAQDGDVNELLKNAEIVADRKRVWEQAILVARRRRELFAAIRSGKLSRESLSSAELEILDSVQRLEKQGFFEAWASRLFGTGLSALFASLVSTASAFAGNCANQVLKYPLLLKLGIVASGLGVIALAGALLLWVIQRWML